MGTIHHFGDSYASTGREDKHFVELLSNRMGYDFKMINTTKPGSSNELMLNNLLYKIFEIKDNDILFFNFSFFTRGCYYDKDHKEMRSTNSFYSDGPYGHKDIFNCDHQYIRDIITYQLDCSEDYNRRLFHQFNTLFEQLHKRNILIYYIFIEETPWCNELLGYGNKITFENGFINWLHSNGYHNEEECHYTRGVQGIICNYVMEQIKNNHSPKLI
jgi:hypothetical protein